MNCDEDDNISRLKFIGKIKKGDKINLKYMYVQQNNIFTKINRSFFSVDNRSNTLNFITDTIKKGFEELKVHIDNNTIFDSTIASNMVVDLDNCKNGLTNLKDTYNDDVMFCCKIDTILQEIDARIEEIKTNNKFINKNLDSNNLD